MKVPTLSGNLPIVDDQGRPTPAFVQWWGNSIASIVLQVNVQAQLIIDLTATEATLATAVADIAAAQAAITGLTSDLTGYVAKNQAARPAYTAYAGQTVSNPPTQGEVQAIDSAVVALASAYTSLATALHTAGVLT